MPEKLIRGGALRVYRFATGVPPKRVRAPLAKRSADPMSETAVRGRAHTAPAALATAGVVLRIGPVLGPGPRDKRGPIKPPVRRKPLVKRQAKVRLGARATKIPAGESPLLAGTPG